MLFTRSSEELENREEGSFLLLVFEKQTRKRSFAKTAIQIARLEQQA
jgi:hypothetical protein